ncbi:cyclin-d3-2 [Phtheirospermum japonicum]|uniref:Cyclin-d3-2 n=1 Tax=Phtheirospermum japonicum TaxID=374723 RepID=A0A830CEL1_9LAMI|nr:cyclin-d3-2 [Phtheirospermum japonicum]
MLSNDAIKWMLSVIGYYGFSALTSVLVLNYYDIFITSLCFQKDKPWMSQLATIACLSIAAKAEETQVLLLLDLQEKIDDCHKLIVESMMDKLSRKYCLKRKHFSIPNNLSGVIDAYFSSDNSVNLWAVGSSVSALPEPFFKRSRAQNQHMRLTPMVGVAYRTN